MASALNVGALALNTNACLVPRTRGSVGSEVSGILGDGLCWDFDGNLRRGRREKNSRMKPGLAFSVLTSPGVNSETLVNFSLFDLMSCS